MGDRVPPDAVALIRQWTQVETPPLLPELRFFTATEETPLWEATEAFLDQTNMPPPFWAFCWAGGQALARYMFDHPDSVRGRHVLDFAAGCGVGAIAALRAGARRADANEIDPLACAAIGLNGAENGMDATRLTVLSGDVIGAVDRSWDVVLAADVLYERALADRVLPWLRDLAALGVRVLISDPRRSYCPEAGAVATAAGGRLVELARYQVPVPEAVEGCAERDTTVFALVV